MTDAVEDGLARIEVIGSTTRYNFPVRGQDPGKARRLLKEGRTWRRLVEQPPPWRRPEWWEWHRQREWLLVLVPVLLFAVRFLVRVLTHGR